VLHGEARNRQRHLRAAARPLTPRLAALAAGCALLVAGCGSDDGEDPASPGDEGIELEVRLDPDGDGGEPEASAEVSCTSTSHCPAGASGLEAEDFEPVPPQTACTEIFGGPDTATVSGTIDGEAVEATLTRSNGCEIERFDRFTPLLKELFAGYEPGASLQP
jgi:hypothetical protein